MRTNYLSKLYCPTYKAGYPVWGVSHLSKLVNPDSGVERAWVELMRGWLGYADGCRYLFDQSFQENPKRGVYWKVIGVMLSMMLHDGTGDLDDDILFTHIRNALHAEGFDADNEFHKWREKI